MNKTVSINLAGIIFTIDDQAYAKLKDYLETIEGYFSEGDGKKEIMGDIEARIAEMFQEKLKNGRMVVSMEDVAELMSIMGEPEAYLDEEAEQAQKARSTQDEYEPKASSSAKRLFRDPDRRVFGGVCSGIGHYFNIDPVILRILFVVSFIFFGTGILIYIILWLVVPKAITAADKLAMKGEAINVENIKRKVQEEGEFVKKKFDEVAGKASKASRSITDRSGDFIERLGKFILNLVNYIFRFFGKFLGIIFLVASSIGIVSLVSATVMNGNVAFFHVDEFEYSGNFGNIANYFFQSNGELNFFIIGALLLSCAPLGFLFIAGLKLLGSKISLRWPALGLGTAFLIGLIITIVASGRVSKQFSVDDGIKTEIAIAPTLADTFYVSVTNAEKYGKRRHGLGSKLVSLDDEKLRIKDVGFDVVESPDDSIYVQILMNSRGSSVKECRVRAEKIEYKFNITDNYLSFDPFFVVRKEDGWRMQDVAIRLMLPQGKSVYLGESTDIILDDVQNVTNTHDRDMIRKTWRMESDGLSCTSCGI